MVSTSACLDGCCSGSSGLPTSTVACGGTKEFVVGWLPGLLRGPDLRSLVVDL
jgi:hypothetical protein